MRQRPANKKTGFTLIEMIVALSIFVLVLLIATNAYVMINRSQRKVAATQKIQDDVRYLMEVMAQDIRLGRVNYSFYAANDIDLHPSAPTQPVTVLALINQTNQNIFYRRVASQRIQYCKELTAGLCDLTAGTGWNDLTPNDVSIAELRFVITPTADPFTELVLPTTCAAASGKTGACLTVYGYSCPAAGGYCSYYSDGQHFQPKVRMIIRSLADDPNLPVASRTLNLQSTVSSRLILGQVKNTYYDL